MFGRNSTKPEKKRHMNEFDSFLIEQQLTSSVAPTPFGELVKAAT